MATIELQLSPTIIKWIASTQGVTTKHLAETLTPKKPHKLLAGEVSKSVAEKLAKLAGIPFGYLFLDKPPEIDEPQIPDFRKTINNISLSKNFFDTYHDIQYKTEWYREYLKESGLDKKPSFIGRYTINSSVFEVSNDITETLNFDVSKIIKKVTLSSYFGVVTKLIENAGILVFKNSLVGNNPHRKLDVTEFRGFSIVDDIAPVVFVNGADTFSAQVFTLFHEVAHIWIGKGGISDWDYENKVESFCNKVAAEILMPTRLFQELWSSEKKSGIDDIHAINNVAKTFRMSNYAAAIKAKNTELIDDNVFLEVKKTSLSGTKNTKKNNGGDPFNIIPYRNSPKITDTVLSYAMAQKIPLREAGNLLNVKADTVINLYRKRTFK
ncbi:hypothetical protein Xvie_03978 [Xenorhabdus vietnamensis]|uniref:IrrE N-terminal-like domain-containing protein n=1 Tax=Xenorhabdus vietnamensis TaxID=351656 RepID=A0A1Y2S7K3_9GAMM|nr:ImmA/IrrE family metallo-endopeptidase [Xenorhabdus vietnamensis]OTA14124.1 hypothetical protein Xvie_03978 [Xenorhabdus vietnamensis]